MPRPTVAQLFSVLAALSLVLACGKGETAEGTAKRADSAAGAAPAVASAQGTLGGAAGANKAPM